MPKLGPIWIDDRILDAIRDDRLVVFAGAGVSMGPPANLPDFVKLAKDIAAGTGLVLTEMEPIDRFLGLLAHKGVEVHQRAAHRLSDPESAPTALHLNLMRLFSKPDRVRLVTTNFDLHFQTASQTVFGQCPRAFCAPALPLGGDFRGLVHVHGALTHPPEMILTDTDFGRGYLTEGWARRFLVDVFRTYTVLFVGYSHNDVVMNYLARALPAEGVAGRYALTEEDGDWKLLGITPIRFRMGRARMRSKSCTTVFTFWPSGPHVGCWTGKASWPRLAVGSRLPMRKQQVKLSWPCGKSTPLAFCYKWRVCRDGRNG